jgi:hypothetical protein
VCDGMEGNILGTTMVLANVHAYLNAHGRTSRNTVAVLAQTVVQSVSCPAHQIRNAIQDPAEFAVSWMLAGCRD